MSLNSQKFWSAKRSAATTAVLALAALSGCYAPPQHASAPPPGAPPTYMHDPVKPIPESSATDTPQLPFDDAPLVNQRPPEEPRYVQAYNTVGRPRIMLFVNRTLGGELVPVNANDPTVSVEHTQQSNSGVNVGQTSNAGGASAYGSYSQNANRSFQSTGPAKYTERTDVYLHPGQYDEAAAKSIDYEMIESITTDWLSASGQVTIISPIAARGRLSDQEVQELQSGRPQMLGEIAEKLNTDVLVQITARPSQQTSSGLGIRLIAQALNVKGGQAIAQASVDVPPPMEKTTLNRYTRFVARKLMDSMSNTWNTMASLPPPPTTAAPTTPSPASSTPHPMSPAAAPSMGGTSTASPTTTPAPQ